MDSPYCSKNTTGCSTLADPRGKKRALPSGDFSQLYPVSLSSHWWKGCRGGGLGPSQKTFIFMRFHGVFLGNQHEMWSKQHNGKVSYILSHLFPLFHSYCYSRVIIILKT